MNFLISGWRYVGTTPPEVPFKCAIAQVFCTNYNRWIMSIAIKLDNPHQSAYKQDYSIEIFLLSIKNEVHLFCSTEQT